MSELTLADLCLELVDCEHKTAPIDAQGDYYAVGTPAMRGNRIDYAEARQISQTTFAQWTRRLRPRREDLLLAREAPVGPVVRVPEAENVAPGQRTVLLRPDPSAVDPRFLFYKLVSPQVQDLLQIKAAGSTVAHLNVPDIRRLPLVVPDLPVQHGIVEVLGALDDKIAANAQLSRAAGGLAIAHCSQARDLVALGAIARQSRITIKPKAMSGGRVWQYSLPAFDDGERPGDAAPESIKSAKFHLDQPCILVSKLNPRIPRIWNVPLLPIGVAVASTEFVVLKSDVCSTTVLWALTSQRQFSSMLEEQVTGTSGSHQRVKPADLLATSIGDPRQLSQACLDLVTSLGLVRNQAIEESAGLKTVRDTLLPHLMSGRLRVRDAEKIVGDRM